MRLESCEMGYYAVPTFETRCARCVATNELQNYSTHYNRYTREQYNLIARYDAIELKTGCSYF